MGPKASRAVPELTQTLENPFVPIQMGTDSRSEIHEKLLNIHYFLEASFSSRARISAALAAEA